MSDEPRMLPVTHDWFEGRKLMRRITGYRCERCGYFEPYGQRLRALEEPHRCRATALRGATQ